MLRKGTSELPGEGDKLGGWGKQSSLAPTFFLGGLGGELGIFHFINFTRGNSQHAASSL